MNIKTLFCEIEKYEIYHPLLHDIFIRNAVIESKEIHSIPVQTIFNDKVMLGITSPIAQNHEIIISLKKILKRKSCLLTESVFFFKLYFIILNFSLNFIIFYL